MLAPSTQPPIFPFDNSYARLPERFYARQAPAPVPAPSLVRLNEGPVSYTHLTLPTILLV